MDRLIKRIGKLKVENASTDKSKATKVRNVLVFGASQAGKSTLIQHMKKYADPEIEIDRKKIGLGMLPHTKVVYTTAIATDLPEYYVKIKKDGTVFDYGALKKIEDKYDYEDKINKRANALEVKRGKSRVPTNVTFNLIDTPGLQDSTGANEEHIRKVFKVLKEVKRIHLILVVMPLGPFTQGLATTIKDYVDMFPGFDGIIAFVYSHYDYVNFHQDRTTDSMGVDLKRNVIREVLGRDTYPYFKIDCNVGNAKPIRECITQNTIQKILELALFNRPVPVMHTVIGKTHKMRDIDRVLRNKFEAASETIEKTLRFKNPEEGNLLIEIFRNETKVYDLKAKIRVLDEFIARHEVEHLELLYEKRFDTDYDVYSGVDVGHKCISCPEHAFEIGEVDLLHHNVRCFNECRSKRAWKVDFEESSDHPSVIHARIYATKSLMYQEKIKKKREEREGLVASLLEATERLRNHAVSAREKLAGITVIVEHHRVGLKIIEFTANDVLDESVFNALLDAKAYFGAANECALKVQGVYLTLPPPVGIVDV